MASSSEIVTAAQLDAMTPNERAAIFEERIVRDLDELPSDFRTRVEATVRQLAAERRPPNSA